jgi:thymidine phosphorylase
LRELVLNLAAHLLVQCGLANSFELALSNARHCLDSGQPLFKFHEMLAAQGADLEAFEKKLKLDHTAPVVVELKAAGDGLFTGMDARIVGEVVRDLGGGRLHKDSVIQPEVGLDQLAPVGDAVLRGAIICRVHAMTEAEAETAVQRLRTSFNLSIARPDEPPLIEAIVPE